MLKSVIPIVTSFALFGALVLSGDRAKSRVAEVKRDRDSVLTTIKERLAAEERLLGSGDSLPSVTLRGADGESISLEDLPRRGARYIYMYRNDCPPCQLLASVWGASNPDKRDSVAFIAFHPDHDVAPERLPRHYAWVHDSLTRGRYFLHVPSLLVVSEDGRVMSAAQSSLIKVGKVFDLYSVLPYAVLDTALARARRGETQLPKRSPLPVN